MLGPTWPIKIKGVFDQTPTHFVLIFFLMNVEDRNQRWKRDLKKSFFFKVSLFLRINETTKCFWYGYPSSKKYTTWRKIDFDKLELRLLPIWRTKILKISFATLNRTMSLCTGSDNTNIFCVSHTQRFSSLHYFRF